MKKLRKLDIKVTEEQIKALDRTAKLLGLTRSELIRWLVEELALFLRVVEKGYIVEDSKIRDILAVFLQSRRTSFVLSQDYRVILRELETYGGKALLKAFEKFKKEES